MAKKHIRLVKKAAEIYKEEVSKKKRGTVSSRLQEQGISKELAEKVQKSISKHPPKARKSIEDQLDKAIQHKKAGNISLESLTKIVEEAISEAEKGASKEEIRDLIEEIVKSELEKEEKRRAYYLQTSSAGIAQERRAIGQFRIPLPSIERSGTLKTPRAFGAEWKTEDLTKVNITYPLYFKGGKVHVYANIRYDPETTGLLYRVIEPKLTIPEKGMLSKIEHALVDELEVDFAELKRETAERYLDEKVQEVIDYYGLKMSERTRELINYYINRDFIGLGMIEPLFQDPNIEDISCDGVGIPIYVYHRDPRFGSIRTNIMFLTEDDLDSFVMKLAQRCGRAISVADPLLDGALPDGSRVQATFGTGIAMKGSNFTIRKFMKSPLTFVDLLNYRTVNSEMLAYLWLAIEHGKSILIAGPTASGKTTLLNSLSLFIRPELKIVTIEDTPELRLPHENWVASVARTGFGPEGMSGKKLGEITLFDLLKASLRQRPDDIIVGEVRGKEAYVLFQQIATGHPGMSTIHADSLQAVINRLRTPPIELPPSLIQHLDILIVITRQRLKGRYVRRIKNITEITGYDIDRDRPETLVSYVWDPASDKFKYLGASAILKNIMEIMGSTPEGIYLEVQRRMKVIEWMQSKGIRDYKNVGRVIHEYYQNPVGLLKQLGIK